MYEILKYFILLICIVGIIYIIFIRFKNNTKSSSKEDIIKYFKDKDITSLEKGIKTKELPKEILKSPYLLMLVQDKTLIFQKGRYFLNK